MTSKKSLNPTHNWDSYATAQKKDFYIYFFTIKRGYSAPPMSSNGKQRIIATARVTVCNGFLGLYIMVEGYPL